MVSWGQNFKNMQKKHLSRTLELFCAENCWKKNAEHSRNEVKLKIGQLAKAIAFAQCSVWVKSEKSQKYAKNILQEHLFCSVQKKKNAKKKTSKIRAMKQF